MTSNCPRRDPPTASRNILFEKSPIVNTDFVWEGRGREGGGGKEEGWLSMSYMLQRLS